VSFLDNLSNINKPDKKTKVRELWDVEGIIKDKSNQVFKFDLRPLKNNIKGGSFNTKADKMVFDINNKYVIVDIEELHKYLKNKKLKKVELEDLISNLEWNIIIKK